MIAGRPVSHTFLRLLDSPEFPAWAGPPVPTANRPSFATGDRTRSHREHPASRLARPLPEKVTSMPAMTGLAHSRRPMPPGAASLRDSFGQIDGIIARIRVAFAERRIRREERRILLGLSDRDLSDMRIARAAIPDVVNRTLLPPH